MTNGESNQWHEQPAIVKSNLKSILVFVKHPPGSHKMVNYILCEMSNRTTRYSKAVDRVLFRIVYTDNNRRSQGARCSSINQQWQLLYPAGRSWSRSKISEERQVGRSGQHFIGAGGEAMIDMLLIICNKIWQTGEWPSPWTQSPIITLPKKGNLQLCQNYRTISLISHPSKVMLRILLNRLAP